MNSGERDGNSLEQVVVGMQVKTPGCWDGKFLNDRDEPYREAVHGLNPLRQGFTRSKLGVSAPAAGRRPPAGTEMPETTDGHAAHAHAPCRPGRPGSQT
jgi:hypothetical protein